MGRLGFAVLCAALAPAFPRDCSEPGVNCKTTHCCQDPLMRCFEKDESWASCKSDCQPGVDPLDPAEFQTPWACGVLEDAAAPAEGGAGPGAWQQRGLPEWPEARLPPGVQPAPPAPKCSRGVTKGAVAVAGVIGHTYAAGNGGVVSERGLLMGHNSGYSIMSACKRRFDPDSFAVFKLLGRKLSYTVDLSRVGCACNLALYLIAQPGLGEDGLPNPGPEGDFYCDANQVGNQWCPEVDIMEANSHVFAATPHTCDQPSGAGHYYNCDRGGRGQNTRDLPGAYGLGSEFTINTQKPFTVTTEFSSIAGRMLTGMRTVLSQEGREVALDHPDCNGGYLTALSNVMADGMAIRITYWGKRARTMSWLDMPPCPAVRCEAETAGVAVIANLAVQGTPFSVVTDKSTTTTTRLSLPLSTLPPDALTEEPNATEPPLATESPAWQPTWAPAAPLEPLAAPGAPFGLGVDPKTLLAAAIAVVSAAVLLFTYVPQCFQGQNSTYTRLPPGFLRQQHGAPALLGPVQGQGWHGGAWGPPLAGPPGPGPLPFPGPHGQPGSFGGYNGAGQVLGTMVPAPARQFVPGGGAARGWQFGTMAAGQPSVGGHLLGAIPDGQAFSSAAQHPGRSSAGM